jgi:hypothetical protein
MNGSSNTCPNLRLSLQIPVSILDEQDDRNNVDDDNYEIDQPNIVEEVQKKCSDEQYESKVISNPVTSIDEDEQSQEHNSDSNGKGSHNPFYEGWD